MLVSLFFLTRSYRLPQRSKFTRRAVPDQHLHFVNGQLSKRKPPVGRPDIESTLAQSFLTQPKPLTVIHQNFDGGCSLIAENKDMAGKRIGLKNIPTDAGQSINAFPEVYGLYR
jgi:hypothetical protein